MMQIQAFADYDKLKKNYDSSGAAELGGPGGASGPPIFHMAFDKIIRFWPTKSKLDNTYI